MAPKESRYPIKVSSILGNLGNIVYTLGYRVKGIALMRQTSAIFETIESAFAQWEQKKMINWKGIG
jgi:hypothetical protein